MALNSELIAIEAQHNVYVQRLAAQYGNEIIPYTDAMTEQINARLNREVGKNLTPNRRRNLLRDINEIVNTQLRGWTSDLRANNGDSGKYEADFQSKTVASLYTTAETVTIPKRQVVSEANSTLIKVGDDSYTTYTNMLNNFTRQNAQQIDAIVQQGLVYGVTTRDIVNDIMKSVDSRVVKTKKQARSVANTGTNHYANVARITYFDNEPVVIGWRFNATLDSKTSTICRGLDGQLFKKGTPGYEKARPPRHPNCRSAAVPEVDGRYKSQDEGGERPENFRDADSGYLMPGQTSSKKIYYEALRGLDAASMDLAIGPTLGKAYRKGLKDGTLTPDSFAKMTIDDINYNPLTIEEMKKKDDALGEILRQQNQ